VYKQWGKVDGKVFGLYTINLPISVHAVFVAVASTYSNSGGNKGNSGQTYAYTQDTFQALFDIGGGIWIAICK